MKTSVIKSLVAGAAAALVFTSAANAHLVAFGWKDNGNGTVTMYGQHWHGDQSSPYSDNGGVRIGTWGTDPSTWQLFQWTGFVNNIGGNSTQNDALVTGGTLTGWAFEPTNWSNTSAENDWFFTDPLVIGNGTYGLFTGTNCCVDTMSAPGQFTLTGITSVPPGTGPGGGVPDGGSFALYGLAFLGLCLARRGVKA